MKRIDHRLRGDSPATTRYLQALSFSGAGSRKAYLQAGLHADEMPGVLILQHLIPLLAEAEAKGKLRGEVLVVPVANPIGLAQWSYQRPVGRYEADSLHNFNRGFPDLSREVLDAIPAVLTDKGDANLAIIRQSFRAAASALAAAALSDMAEMQATLLSWSCDADYVLDLHCDHRAVMHLYANSARPDDTALLCRAVGAELALIQDVSGGNAFDEANSAPWLHLLAALGDRFPIPQGCFATTLEYRGQFDVEDDLAARDARNLMTFLAATGFVADHEETPAYPLPPLLPLGGAVEVFAPQGGVVSWKARPGDQVKCDEVLAVVRDPATSAGKPVVSPCDGMMFRHELWPSCLRGQSLAHVAGEIVLRSGDLLSD